MFGYDGGMVHARAPVPVYVAPLQRSLLDGGEPSIDAGFSSLERRWLSPDSWIDHQPGWLHGAGSVFETVLASAPWRTHERAMFERMVVEPRLSCWFPTGARLPEPRWILAEMGGVLGARYQRGLDTLGLNLYRDGGDGVAWHGDRVARDRPQALVAIVSVGRRRPFLVRPSGGGASRRYDLGDGDLLVMGGACQREFQHCVPKRAGAGPRISITFRSAVEFTAGTSEQVTRSGRPGRSAHGSTGAPEARTGDWAAG